MRDTKVILKEAREAIKNKNYESCMKLCKSVLREESDNYMALVFLGVSLQEVGQNTKALDAFQNAVKVNPSNSLGWNGLINYYEKINTKETKNDLIKAYIALLNSEIAEKKLIECTQKLCNLCELENTTEIASAVYSLLKSGKCTNVTELAALLVEILSKDKNLSLDLILIYEESLKIVLGDQKTVCVKYYTEFLNLLYKSNRRDELFTYAKKMHGIFQSDSISLKWICKIFNDIYVETNITKEQEDNMTQYSDQLLKVEPKSATALFTKSILLVENSKIPEAKELLDQVVSLLPGLQHAWILLLRCCLKLNQFTEAIQAANKIDKFLQSDSQHKLKPVAEVFMVEALSRSDEAEDLKKALEMYENINDKSKPSCICHVIRANIGLKNFAQAESLLEYLQRSGDNETARKLLTAQLLAKQNKHQEALDILKNENVELSEWWLEIGALYWELKQFEKSLVPYLKAAKLDSNNHKCFLLLGNYYKHSNDLDKARRCYEKSFKLNTRSSEAGIELSKIYRKLKNWDANLRLLQALTGGVINKKNSWAWMQLGLQYLEQQEYDNAIANLRFVIRIDESNMNCWESLADAYLAKGAYTSALKCYEKVSAMCEDTLYPLLQMATIKQILGEYTEANTVFQQILTSNSSYVPALKGMAETCLLQAKECFKNQRLGTSRDYAQSSADHIITALQQNNNLGCLWKLLGDTCVLVTELSEKYRFLTVFAPFMEEDGTLKLQSLFNLTAKCYYRSIKCLEDNILIWHDLAVCYLSHSRKTENPELSQQLVNKAQLIAQYCTSNNATYWQHWNLLGNIAMCLDPPNYCLAQHSFIKAVIAENNSAVSWCNLGTLYFMLDDYKLANKAYSQAQRADPNYVNSWIGQALLAENFGHEDAMDLFRHSTQLGFHRQGALGYGYSICKTLKESPLDAVIYSIHHMHAIPVACDAMTWYTEHNPHNGTAWNMLGIFKERLSLKTGTMEAFRNSLNLVKPELLDSVRVNYGRSLAQLNKYSQAVDVFAKVETATFSSSSGLALALFKDKRYKESYEVYESTLHWLSEESNHQSDLLTALASMAYMFDDGVEAAETLLLQSIQLDNPSPWGFYATLALRLHLCDFTTGQLVLNKMQAFKDRKYCVQHIAALTGYFYFLKKDYKRCICEVSRIIHKYPDQAQIWLTLSSLLMQFEKEEERRPKAAAKCAQIAMKLGQCTMDVRKVLPLVALSLYEAGDRQEAQLMAQKAVHCYPDLAETWTILIAVLLNHPELAVNRLKDIVSFTKKICNDNNISQWLDTIPSLCL